MLAPVVIFVYNRYHQAKLCIESLSKNSIAQDSDVYIFSDGKKDSDKTDKVNQVRDYIDSLVGNNVFKNLHIEKSDHNKGLAESVIYGVNCIIEQYGNIIVLEDDLVTSTDFLQYMNDALTFYENNNKIWSISGYTYDFKIPNYHNHDIFLAYRACSWGWATWKNRWKVTDWEVKDFNELITKKTMQKQFLRGGYDTVRTLKDWVDGNNDSWAIRWCYTQSKLDMLTVYPIQSRVSNIGFGKDGTHYSKEEPKFHTDLEHGCKKCKFENIEMDEVINKKFNNYYLSHTTFILSNIKIFLLKILHFIKKQ